MPPKQSSNSPNKANRGGRPTKKTKGRVAKTLELAAKGKTNKEIAKIIGVAESTIRYWQKMDFGFSAAVKELKLEADQLIEASLFKTALGFKKTYKTEKVTKDGDVVDYKETIYIHPSPTAQIFWLKNRQPERWREKVEHEHGGKDGKPLEFTIRRYLGK